ncbi:MAG: hypothetical protein GWP08_00965 [Nitrospiraceae bacterium]|nr:hypothetical protein [Nitrospiraceae bacterium]
MRKKREQRAKPACRHLGQGAERQPSKEVMPTALGGSTSALSSQSRPGYARREKLWPGFVPRTMIRMNGDDNRG